MIWLNKDKTRNLKDLLFVKYTFPKNISKICVQIYVQSTSSMNNWNTVTFSTSCWRGKYSEVEKVFLWILELIETWRYQFVCMNLSLQGGLSESTNFRFCIRLFVSKLLSRKLFQRKSIPGGLKTLPFTHDCRLVFPGGYHAASYPVLASLLCLGMFF